MKTILKRLSSAAVILVLCTGLLSCGQAGQAGQNSAAGQTGMEAQVGQTGMEAQIGQTNAEEQAVSGDPDDRTSVEGTKLVILHTNDMHGYLQASDSCLGIGAVAQAQIDELKGQGCSLIVCVGHLGEIQANEGNNAENIVANTSGLSVVIDGHDHLVENQTVKDKEGNDVLIAETGYFLRNIGILTYEDGKFTESLATPGSRITISEVGEKEFDPEAIYAIATNEFVATGGDTYYCFAEAGAKTLMYVGYLDYEGMINYMKTELEGTIPEIYEETQGRITVVGE